VYYYFRVIQSMYFRDSENPGIVVSNRFKTILVITAAMIILLGIKPGLLLNLLNV
jgi:NADH-quinone oxidoreductase subunit N